MLEWFLRLYNLLEIEEKKTEMKNIVVVYLTSSAQSIEFLTAKCCNKTCDCKFIFTIVICC